MDGVVDRGVEGEVDRSPQLAMWDYATTLCSKLPGIGEFADPVDFLQRVLLAGSDWEKKMFFFEVSCEKIHLSYSPYGIHSHSFLFELQYTTKLEYSSHRHSVPVTMFVGALALEHDGSDADVLDILTSSQWEIEVHQLPRYLFVAIPTDISERIKVQEGMFHGEQYVPVSVVYLHHAHYTSQVCVSQGAWYTHNSMGAGSGVLRLNSNGFFDETYLFTCKRMVVYEKVNKD